MGFGAYLSTAALVVIILSIRLKLFTRSKMVECDQFREQFVNDQMNDITGKVVIITGANAGLGYHAALTFAKSRAKVIMGCRSASKCKAAKDQIVAAWEGAEVFPMDLDLASFASVKKFVVGIEKNFGSVDVVINNAAIFVDDEPNVVTSTQDGLESYIGISHFGRIINVSSALRLLAEKKFPFENLMSEKSFSHTIAYANAKLANLLFTFELNKRLERSGNSREIIAIANHPGFTETDLQKGFIRKYVSPNFGMTLENGIVSYLVAAVGEGVAASRSTYIGPKYLGCFGVPEEQSTSAASTDPRAQEFLWAESVRLTGADFNGL